MKKSIIIPLLFLPLLWLSGCGQKSRQAQEANETTEASVPDTGYTGIKQFFNGNFLSYEAEFKNGVRHGLMKTYYYPSGKLYQTFRYVNGVREDTAIWYYEDGRIFRKTPFRRDSMNGVQIQYYKSGKIRAKLEFENGLRKPYLEEFRNDGTKITDYPEVIVKTTDEYSTGGSYTIRLSLSRPNVKATFYRGGYDNGLFNPKKLTKINDTEYTGYLKLKKSGTPGHDFVEIIAEISTTLGNKMLEYKKIGLPYNDLR